MTLPAAEHPAAAPPSAQTPSLSRLQMFYGDLRAEALLRVMIKLEFPGKIALLSSFGADAAVLIALVAEVDPATPILFLETEKHFPETLAYVEALKQKLGLTNVVYVRPDPAMVSRIDADGELWKTTPNRCCWMRKVEPLRRAVKELGVQALITGRKRYQTDDRKVMDGIELDEDGIFRINPLSGWTKEDTARVMQERGLPQHPLVEKGYLSIGCAPCTRPVKAGEDERAGRWAHTADFPGAQKVECGIHVPNAAEAVSWDL